MLSFHTMLISGLLQHCTMLGKQCLLDNQRRGAKRSAPQAEIDSQLWLSPSLKGTETLVLLVEVPP